MWGIPTLNGKKIERMGFVREPSQLIARYNGASGLSRFVVFSVHLVAHHREIAFRALERIGFEREVD